MNPSFRSLFCRQDNANYIYTMSKEAEFVIYKLNYRTRLIERVDGADIRPSREGLYCYEISRLITEGVIESYFLSSAVVGHSGRCFDSV